MRKIVRRCHRGVGTAWRRWFAGHGFEAGRHDHFVTVKGLAERDVKADLALWPLRFIEAGNDLAKVQAAIQHDEDSVVAFLQRHKIESSDIAWRTLVVIEKHA